MKEKFYVLKKGNQLWSELTREELDKWTNDGSVREGDLIITPKEVLIAEKKIELVLRTKDD